jgi:hypothetical protein
MTLPAFGTANLVSRYSKFRDSRHRIRAHRCTNQTVPYGTALVGWCCPRHIVPGYNRTVPLGLFAAGSSQLLWIDKLRHPVSGTASSR